MGWVHEAVGRTLGKKSPKPLADPGRGELIDVEIRGERDPNVAARRAELRNMLRSGKTPTTQSVCKRWDSENIKVPEAWTEEGIATWQKAFQLQTHRGRVKKLVSKDSNFIRSHS